jgi:hypothetical protein
MGNALARRTMTAVLGAAAAGVLLLPASTAFASASHPNPVGHTFDIGPAPTALPSNCSFANQDASFLLISGSAVSHDTSNKNGDWGGLTIQGTAIFQEAPFSGFDDNGNPIDTGAPVPLYQGHVSIWTGGGNNAGGQSEFGLTVDFHGSSASGNLDLHVTAHQTANNSGNLTASVQNVKVTCS